MKKRLPKHIIERLREARKSATLETASFAFPGDILFARHMAENDFMGHPDDYIKARVKNHHQSWIIGPLDEVIAWAEGGDL